MSYWVGRDLSADLKSYCEDFVKSKNHKRDLIECDFDAYLSQSDKLDREEKMLKDSIVTIALLMNGYVSDIETHRYMSTNQYLNKVYQEIKDEEQLRTGDI